MQLSCKLHKEDKRSSIQYVAAGCEPYTASETFRNAFRPYDNSLFIRHLTHNVLLCKIVSHICGAYSYQ